MVVEVFVLIIGIHKTNFSFPYVSNSLFFLGSICVELIKYVQLIIY